MSRQDTQGPEYRRIIDELIRRRKAASITQVELAQRMGIDQSKVSKFERRERRLDVVDYVKYCRSIGLDPGLLLEDLLPWMPAKPDQVAARDD